MNSSEQKKRFNKVLTDFKNGGKENESHADTALGSLNRQINPVNRWIQQ